MSTRFARDGLARGRELALAADSRATDDERFALARHGFVVLSTPGRQ